MPRERSYWQTPVAPSSLDSSISFSAESDVCGATKRQLGINTKGILALNYCFDTVYPVYVIYIRRARKWHLRL